MKKEEKWNDKIKQQSQQQIKQGLQDQQIRMNIVSDGINKLRSKLNNILRIFKLDNNNIIQIPFLQNLYQSSQPYIDSYARLIDDFITHQINHYFQFKKSYNSGIVKEQILIKIIDFFIMSMSEIDPSMIEKSHAFQKIQKHEILFEQQLQQNNYNNNTTNHQQLQILPLLSKQMSIQEKIQLLLLFVNEQAKHQIDSVLVKHPIFVLLDTKYQIFDKLKQLKTFYVVVNDALGELVVDPIVKSLDYQRSAIIYYAQPIIDRFKQLNLMNECQLLQFSFCQDQMLFKAVQAKSYIILKFQFKEKNLFKHFSSVLGIFFDKTFHVPIYYTHQDLYIYCGVLFDSFVIYSYHLYHFLQSEFDHFISSSSTSAKNILNNNPSNPIRQKAQLLYTDAVEIYKANKQKLMIKYSNQQLEGQ